MAQIALNKPSGGQLLIQPEDGTSTETVTIPSVGVGKVLQVVQATTSTRTDYGSTSEVATTGMSATITPTSSTSKILVMVNCTEFRTAGDVGGRFALFRGVVRLGTIINELGYHPANASETHGQAFFSTYIDTPTTIEAHTYTLYGRKLIGNGGACSFNANQASISSITLMEVAA